MIQINIIKDIINWIELNLTNYLSIDIIANKSGYTKWHLQRLFKEHTGVTIGSYIRDRRLTCSAIDLRFTNDNIIDIYLRYSFDSQQTFCRSFKKKFNISPNKYRKNIKWNLNEMTFKYYDYVLLPFYKKIKTAPLIYDSSNMGNAKIEMLNYDCSMPILINGMELMICLNSKYICNYVSGESICSYMRKNKINQPGNYLEIKFNIECINVSLIDMIYNVYDYILKIYSIDRGCGFDILNFIPCSKFNEDGIKLTSLINIKEVVYYIPI